MADRFYLNDEDYHRMMTSRYVRAFVNPSYPDEGRSSLSLQQKFNDPAHFQVEDYVGYWTFSSGENRPVPIEVAYFARFLGVRIDLDAQRKAIDQHTAESIRRYRQKTAHQGYDDEQLFEMRAAFGEGTTVVDVLTGKKVLL